jgi:hypothetical protein
MSQISAIPRLPSFLQGYQSETPVISPAFSGELRSQSAAGGRVRMVPVDTGAARAAELAPQVLPEEILLHQAMTASAVAHAPPPPPPAPVVDMSRMDAAVDRLRMLSDRLAADMRNDALEVAMMLARKIVEGELTSNVDKMMGTVRSAVRRLGESRRITVRLSPEDAELLSKGNQPSSELGGLSAAKVEVVADAALGRGDCLVEGDLGSVDARLDTRFAELRRAIAEDAAEGAEV